MRRELSVKSAASGGAGDACDADRVKIGAPRVMPVNENVRHTPSISGWRPSVELRG